ncbi:hypothetical protein ADL19_15630 [Streptomyces purpurogeneiscleroticus]|nr:hypothetical protein ADL19_15630 [Streptomyces purpurogeneiscleroticus]
MSCSVFQPGEDAGERARLIRQRIRQDRPGKPGKPGRVAVGAEGEPRPALRPEPFDHPLQQGPPVEAQQRLVASAHPPRLPAG